MTDSAPSPIPVLIVGSGHGCRVHLPALRATGFAVVGLVGNDSERTARRARNMRIPRGFTDLDTAIAETGARVVTVASPPHSHCQVVLTAIRHGCHILCEKPFARDAAEARRMHDAAREAGVVNLLGNQMRLLPERIAATRAIAAGAIGKPRLVTIIQHISLMNTGIRWPEWWLDPQAGGGWLGASGSHMIDQVHSWLGPIDSLSAALTVVREGVTAVEDSYTLRFTLANGAQGLIQQTGAAHGPMANMTRVVGTEGTLWLDDSGAWLADAGGTRLLPVAEAWRLPQIDISDDPRKRFLHVELPPTIRLCKRLRDAINGCASEPAPAATFADGVACMEVIDAIRRSAAQGGALVPVR